jgi:hypothetical protein
VAHDQPLESKERQAGVAQPLLSGGELGGRHGLGDGARYPGSIIRVAPGGDPTNTALTEVYEPPLPGFGPSGGDIEANNVFWVALASGHLGEFDRRKCKVTNGPDGDRTTLLRGPDAAPVSRAAAPGPVAKSLVGL